MKRRKAKVEPVTREAWKQRAIELQGAVDAAMDRVAKAERRLWIAEDLMRVDSRKWSEAMAQATKARDAAQARAVELEQQVQRLERDAAARDRKARVEARAPQELARSAIEALLKAADYPGEIARLRDRIAAATNLNQATLQRLNHAFGAVAEAVRPGVNWELDPCAVASEILARFALLEKVAEEAAARPPSPACAADQQSLVVDRETRATR